MFAPKLPDCAIHSGACLPACAAPSCGLTRTGAETTRLAAETTLLAGDHLAALAAAGRTAAEVELDLGPRAGP